MDTAESTRQKTMEELEDDLAGAMNALMCADIGIDDNVRRAREMDRYRSQIAAIEKKIAEIAIS
jgi:hypothetical protein